MAVEIIYYKKKIINLRFNIELVSAQLYVSQKIEPKD